VLPTHRVYDERGSRKFVEKGLEAGSYALNLPPYRLQGGGNVLWCIWLSDRIESKTNTVF